MTSALWLPCTQMQQLDQYSPLHIERGSGAYLYDKSGNSYIDAISSWWVTIHGHCHPYINAKVKEQLDKLEHTLLASVTHPQIIKLADKLVELSPKNLTKAFFADSGSAAIECALKMSLQYWHQIGQPSKSTFVSLKHGYHGETLGSLAVTDIPLFNKQYAPLLVQHLRVSSPADIFCPENKTQTEHEADSLLELERLFAEKHQKICAFICEPLVQGACGMGMYSAVYLKKAKALCEEYDIHFIADEIAVGFGRTGSMFACEQANICPDFMCLSKGLTAGYLPMSCVLTTDTIYQAFLDDDPHTGLASAFLHSHSFTGNPLAATAALASLEVFEHDNTLANNQKLIERMQENLKKLSMNIHIKDCRQTGMICAMTISHPSMLGKLIHIEALKQGVLIRPIGNHLYFMPPYCISLAEVDKIFNICIEVIELVIKKHSPAQLTDQQIDPKLLS